MAAGLGFKTFAVGEVLTAADTNGYLMQGVLVFASAAARDAAITSPQEGQFAYLKDTNVTTYYTGSAWANLDTTGMVNPMTTTGDTIYSSSGSTPARLGIGSTGQVLTVAGGVPTWSTPAGGGGKVIQAAFTQNTATYSRSSTGTSDTISLTITPTSATSTIFISCSAAIASDGNNNSREAQIKITDGTTTRTIHKTLSVYAATTYAYNLGVGGSVFFTSPSTSSTTYTLQFQTISAGNFEFYSPSLTIFEVGA